MRKNGDTHSIYSKSCTNSPIDTPIVNKPVTSQLCRRSSLFQSPYLLADGWRCYRTISTYTGGL